MDLSPLSFARSSGFFFIFSQTCLCTVLSLSIFTRNILASLRQKIEPAIKYQAASSSMKECASLRSFPLPLSIIHRCQGNKSFVVQGVCWGISHPGGLRIVISDDDSLFLSRRVREKKTSHVHASDNCLLKRRKAETSTACWVSL